MCDRYCRTLQGQVNSLGPQPHWSNRHALLNPSPYLNYHVRRCRAKAASSTTHRRATASASFCQVVSHLPCMVSPHRHYANQACACYTQCVALQGQGNSLACGDVEEAFASAECERTVEGEARLGGQEHFYLEPNCCVVIPGEHQEITIIASSQVWGLPGTHCSVEGPKDSGCRV